MTNRLFNLLLLVTLAAPALASDFDRATFERLDPDQLRAAEARIHELLEPGTARLLSAPANAAEAYVVQRQQRLAERIRQAPQTQRTTDGALVTATFWPSARATRVSFDSRGRIELRCVEAAELIGHRAPDFRHGNAPQERME